MRKIIVGSRRSKLALTQTNWVIQQLKNLGLPFEFEVKKIVKKGDRILDVTLSKVGGKGLFVKEIEEALLTKEIDMAIHSMKDMPALLPEGLTIGCVPIREDHRDVLISKDGKTFEELKEGAIVGTSSLRRSAQLLAKRPDLQIKWIRGKVDTRLQKLKEEDYDAIILAAAGLKRLGWSSEVITQYLDDSLLYCCWTRCSNRIECRAADEELLQALQSFTNVETEKAVTAERSFLNLMEGGCQVPIAGYAFVNDQGEVTLTALVGSPDGKIILKEQVTGLDALEVGRKAAEAIKLKGGQKLIDDVKAETNPL